MRLFTGMAAALLMAAPAASQEAPRLVLVAPAAESGAFWAAARQGAEAAAQALGATLEAEPPSDGQASAIGAAVAGGADGIIASIADADALAPALAAAAAAGVPLVTIGEGFDVARQLGAALAVGQDDYQAGQAAGEAMRRLGAQSALCLAAAPVSLGQDLRCKGVAEAFDRPVELLAAGGGDDQIEAAITARLEADSAIEAVIDVAGGPAGAAALAAIAGLDRDEPVRLAGFDPSPALLAALADGRAAFAIDQQPRLQGWLAVALLAGHARTGQMPVDDVRTGPRIVTPEEARGRGGAAAD